jgi:glutamyl-tRNA reductase
VRGMSDGPLRLFMFGVARETAPIDRREQLSHAAAAFLEGLVVSTCHRVEFYVVAAHADAAERTVPGRDDWTRKTDLAAAIHLARVSSGLASAVLGEHEIAGQVRRAAAEAERTGALGPHLRHIVAAALAASGRVRSETSLGRGASSIAGAAVQGLEDEGRLDDASVLILGAGAVAQDVARRLSARRPKLRHLAVASRSLEHALRLASEVQADAVYDWHGALARLPLTNVVVAAVHSSGGILSADLLRSAGIPQLQERLVVDLSMPRAFASDASSVPGVRLRNVDEIEIAAAETHRLRQVAVPQAEAIVLHEAGLGFDRFLRRARHHVDVRVA